MTWALTKPGGGIERTELVPKKDAELGGSLVNLVIRHPTLHPSRAGDFRPPQDSAPRFLTAGRNRKERDPNGPRDDRENSSFGLHDFRQGSKECHGREDDGDRRRDPNPSEIPSYVVWR